MESVMIKFLVLIVLSTSSSLAGIWPAGGSFPSPIRQGSQVEITWDQALHADLVDIELWDGERRTYIPVAYSVRSKEAHYLWVVPMSVSPGSLYRFVLRDASDKKRTDYSWGFHTILNASELTTTVEDDMHHADSLFVSPFPAVDRARIAWTGHDAMAIDVIDLQGVTMLHIKPETATRACAIPVSALQNGTYAVVLRFMNGTTRRSTLIVSR